MPQFEKDETTFAWILFYWLHKSFTPLVKSYSESYNCWVRPDIRHTFHWFHFLNNLLLTNFMAIRIKPVKETLNWVLNIRNILIDDIFLNRSLVHWQVYHHYGETVRFFALSALNSGKLLSLGSFRKHSKHRRDKHRLLLDTRNTLYHSLWRIQTVSYRGQGSTDQNRLVPDQDRKNFETWDRTRANKNLKVSDRFGPVGPRTWRSMDPWSRYWYFIFSL